MALRGLGRVVSGPLASAWARCGSTSATTSSSSSAAAASASAPTVFDKMVQIFVIDKSGNRHTVRGLEGESLATTLAESGQFPQDVFMPHPYDPAYPTCHLYVQGDYLQRVNGLSADEQAEQQRIIEHHVRGKARDNSRMGYYIKLAPTLNGMTVALGDMEPWCVLGALCACACRLCCGSLCTACGRAVCM